MSAPRRSERDHALDRIAEAYASYASGRDARWDDSKPGSQIARRQRDTWLLSVVTPTSAGVVLDLGSGDGFLAHLLNLGGMRPDRYVGIDLLPERVAVAQRTAPWAEFMVGSADAIPLPDEAVTVAVAVTLFSSVTEDFLRQAIAREVGRVLAPRGRVVIYDLRYPSPGNRHVKPVSRSELAGLFPGWKATHRTMTVIPPLARSRLAGGAKRYAILHAVPTLRSHLAAVLEKP